MIASTWSLAYISYTCSSSVCVSLFLLRRHHRCTFGNSAHCQREHPYRKYIVCNGSGGLGLEVEGGNRVRGKGFRWFGGGEGAGEQHQATGREGRIRRMISYGMYKQEARIKCGRYLKNRRASRARSGWRDVRSSCQVQLWYYTIAAAGVARLALLPSRRLFTTAE